MLAGLLSELLSSVSTPTPTIAPLQSQACSVCMLHLSSTGGIETTVCIQTLVSIPPVEDKCNIHIQLCRLEGDFVSSVILYGTHPEAIEKILVFKIVMKYCPTSY